MDAVTPRWKPRFERLRTRSVVFIHDLLTIPVAWTLSYWLRFNLGDVPPEFIKNALFHRQIIFEVKRGGTIPRPEFAFYFYRVPGLEIRKPTRVKRPDKPDGRNDDHRIHGQPK